MSKFRVFLGALLIAALAAGASALLLTPVQAAAPTKCLQKPLPPPLEQICRACLHDWSPVLCTVRCAGNTTEEMIFSNQCFANCSGYVFVGDCVYIGP